LSAGDSAAAAALFGEVSYWRDLIERDGETVVLRPKQLVLAAGVSGKPNLPAFPGMDQFAGDQHHSSAHPGPDAYRGKKCVVVGSNNSA
jgi:putative flavoprotein involved in K+ transport